MNINNPLNAKKKWVVGKVKSNDLFEFMHSAKREMNEEYQRIQKRASEDPGTAGDQGEENWATLFRDWLPPSFQIVTKGRILSHEGKASPQIDILILKPEYPKKLLDKKLYLAGGIIAAFECKVTLKASHIKEAIHNSSEIRKLLPKREGTPYKELNSPIIYGLLAHSHSWTSTKSKPLENIESTLLQSDRENVMHPREMLDIICVSDLAYWNANKIVHIGPSYVPWSPELLKIYGASGSTNTSYILHSYDTENQINDFTPIGAMLSSLFEKIGWEYSGIRGLSDYFRLVNISGSGSGTMRLWNTSDVFSKKVQASIFSGHLTNGEPWDEWSVGFS